MTAGTVCHKVVTILLVQDHFGEDTPRRITGAQKQDVKHSNEILMYFPLPFQAPGPHRSA